MGLVWSSSHSLPKQAINLQTSNMFTLTVVEVLQQVLLAGEVQLDLDVNSQCHGLARLKGQVRQSVLQFPRQELSKDFFCKRINHKNQTLKKIFFCVFCAFVRACMS